MGNLRFEYLYRDAGNYKQYGAIVLANPMKVDPEVAVAQLREVLIDRCYFNAIDVCVPSLAPDCTSLDLDHEWHEFDRLVSVTEPPTDPRAFSEFISLLT